MSMAEIKARSRQALHDFMSRPVSFYDSTGNLQEGDFTARRHDEAKANGDLAGTNLSYAEVQERPTQLVFWREQLAATEVRRGCGIIFSAEEGWWVDHRHPAHDQTVNVDVTAMSPSDLLGKTLPDGSTIGAE